jgi:hypothetical protein
LSVISLETDIGKYPFEASCKAAEHRLTDFLQRTISNDRPLDQIGKKIYAKRKNEPEMACMSATCHIL